MNGTRSSFRVAVGLMLAAVLLGGLSVPALGQGVSSRFPTLSEERRARLQEAARNSGLEPWQREFMRELATSVARPSAAAAGAGAVLEADGAWGMIVPPPVRFEYTAVYDPVRERMVVFGGEGEYARGCDDTWVLSLAVTPAWTELSAGGPPPPPRRGQAAIYDPVRDRMVIFGGSGGDSLRNDTWVLSLGSSPTWSALFTSGTRPAERENHTAIYDPVRDRMVIFGGDVGALPYASDTWALSFAGAPTWAELATGGTPPAGRKNHTAIYDPVRDQMVIFGGSTGRYRNDTWALSLGETPTWSEMAPSGTLPGPRADHTAIYDPVRDRMVIFGGGSHDVWTLALAEAPAWAEIIPPETPPPSRWGHGAIYDPGRDRMVMFGGYFDEEHSRWRYSDTWALSLGEAPAWCEITPSGPLPSCRHDHTAIYDPVRDRMVVFGGGQATWEPYRSDTWALSLAGTPAWSELVPFGPLPPARMSQAAIYDPVRDRMVIFGGWDDHYLGDVWALSLAGTPVWSEITTLPPRPGPRCAHTAIYDPVRDRMVVFGGFDGAHYLRDSWALSFAGTPAWSVLAPSGTPLPGRYDHSAIYDPVRDRMLVFGGTKDAADFNDVWALSFAGAGNWSEIIPSGTPPSARLAHTAVYDASRDRMVIFGGWGGWIPYSDSWALSLAGSPAWSELAPSGQPATPRLWHTAMYDPVRDRMAVFGGVGELYLNDTWGLSWTATAVSEPGTVLPVRLALHAACPNPASGPTLVRFDLPASGPARLAIYDVSGRLVRRLMEADAPSGAQQAEWDGRDEAGRDAGPGIYFARLEATGKILTDKIVILR